MVKNKREDKYEYELRNRKYLGAEWTGAPGYSPEFGNLETGKIYPLAEERATPNSGFKPKYAE